jgi:hypothetical protein
MKFDLTQFNVCEDGLIFYDNYDSFEDAWNACPRGDWMLWIAAKLKVDHRILTLAKSRCARTVIHLMEDEKSRNAVEVSEQYGLGTATKEELHKAYQDAFSSSSAYASSAYASSYAAFYAASADAFSACDAAAFSASAAFSAAFSASVASAAYDKAVVATTAKVNNERQTADICREILTELVFKHINETL